MNTDDIIYVSLLVFSIVFGEVYRKLPTVNAKKNYGALVGLGIVFLVSGYHTVHVILTILVNAWIILFVDKRKCHIVSFAVSFTYLIFFRSTTYFGIPYPPNHTNLVQMILTLKLVGLAFEVNNTYEVKRASGQNVQRSDSKKYEFELNFMDIFYYTLSYCGVLTGPYFKYQTYIDHLHRPFYKFDDYRSIALKKLVPQLPVFATIFLVVNSIWPLSYTMSDEFENRSFLYRYWYIWPSFVIFRMRIYIGLLLSECVCVMAGVGIYPRFTKAKSGEGPTENVEKMNEFCEDESRLAVEQYDYETIHNIDPYNADFSPTLREGMRSWNITVQYWLAVYIYKKFPNKKFRTAATFLVSAVWHGVYPGYYVAMMGMPVGMTTEDVWVKLLMKDNPILPHSIGRCLLTFLKMQWFSYLIMAFGLLEINKLLKYYNSVYHCLLFVYVGLYFTGRHLLKLRRT